MQELEKFTSSRVNVRAITNGGHSLSLEEIAAAYDAEDAEIVINEIMKNHPEIVFKVMQEHYLAMENQLKRINSMFDDDRR